jgi:hypothetical protein
LSTAQERVRHLAEIKSATLGFYEETVAYYGLLGRSTDKEIATKYLSHMTMRIDYNDFFSKVRVPDFRTRCNELLPALRWLRRVLHAARVNASPRPVACNTRVSPMQHTQDLRNERQLSH